MQEHPFFTKDQVMILAHRGFTPPEENTLGAFEHAISAGAQVIETDVQATKDGVAVLVHDDDLKRVAGINKKIKDFSLQELEQLNLLDGSKILSLASALSAFPKTKFNLDIKDRNAINGTVSSIEQAKAHDRVLVSSFSNRTRKRSVAKFTTPVATSASASVVISTWLLVVLGKTDLHKHLLGIGALQIPRTMFGIRLDTAKFISSVTKTGTQIHYWTINESKEMKELVALGANGIVTDNTSLAIEALGKTS